MRVDKDEGLGTPQAGDWKTKQLGEVGPAGEGWPRKPGRRK